MKINLNDIIDEFESHWWHYIRAKDFAFLSSIPDFEAVEVFDDDILLHKEIKEGDRFPSKIYHIIVDGEPLQINGQDVRDMLSEKLTEYIKTEKKLPFGCKLNKILKTGNKIVIDYNPNGFDNFQLKFLPEKIFTEEKTHDEIEEYFTELDPPASNALAGDEDPTFDIQPIETNPIVRQVATESGADKVFVFDAEIKKIDRRKTVYMGTESIYYLLKIEGGEVAPDKKKNTIRKPLDQINVKCSEHAMETYELKVGQKITFNGKLKDDKKLKLLIQNVRKFEIA